MPDPLDRLQLLGRLADQVEAFRTSEGWLRWLRVASRFRTYSLRNQLLISAQRPDATYVAGYRTWQSLHRQVRKGETGIRILAPVVVKAAEADAAPDRVLAGFRLVTVFDIAQTDGEPLPEPAWPGVAVPEEGVLGRLVTAAGDHEIQVSFVPQAAGDVRGWWTPATRTVTLVTAYPLASQIRTMLHELAHAVDLPTVERLRCGGSRPVRELVAEAAAYIVGTGRFGLDMDAASAHYTTCWDADRDTLTALATRVLDVAARLEDDLLSDCLGKPV